MFILVMLMGVTMLSAQVVTVSPSPVQQTSQDVVVTFYADRGTAGLKGFTGDVYAHTGVITSKSNNSWAYAPANWGDNSPKYKLTRVSDNVWQLKIGTIKEYYGITDADEKVLKLAFVFRSADCSREGKDTGGKDIFIDVADDGFSISASNDAPDGVVTAPATVNFTVNATTTALLTLNVNGTKIAETTGTTLTHAYRIATAGEYTVEATAVSGGQTKSTTMQIVALGAPVAQNYPGGVPRQGAIEGSDGSVTFCIAAPGKQTVILVPSWDDYKVLSSNMMKYQDYNGNRYFWITVKGLKKSTDYPYYYLVDGSTKVADPYAHLILDPQNDKWLPETLLSRVPAYPYDRFDDTALAVYRSDLDSYSWHDGSFVIPDHDDLLIYEMLVRDFTGTERAANAEGTLISALEKIPYLVKMGVNAVELMPVMEFSGNNSWGYNPNFYMAPDKAYGAPADYKRFIDECHRNGIAVILDIALNHADGLAPWYRMYPHGESPFFNATAPHDWSVFNDWRQENQLVRDHWRDVIDYWMQVYHVDGFRFDLVKGLGDSDSYSKGTDAYNPSRIANMKRIHSYITANNPRGIHINEGFLSLQEDNELAADGQLNWVNVNSESGKWATGQNSNLLRFNAADDGRPAGSAVSYIESHDEQRVAYTQTSTSSAPDALRYTLAQRMPRLASLAAMMILSPGSHMIWQFSELGDEQNNKKGGDNNTDPKMVMWNYLDNIHRGPLQACYQELCWIRRANADMFDTDATVTMMTGTSNWSNGRFIRLVKGGREILLMVNPSYDSPMTLTSAVTSLSPSDYVILSKSKGVDDNVPVTFSGNNVQVTIPANNYIVLGTTGTSGIGEIEGDTEGSTRVYGSEGRIVVEGDYTTVSAYTLTGIPTAGLDNLAPGIYIVNVDGAATKVIVR